MTTMNEGPTSGQVTDPSIPAPKNDVSELIDVLERVSLLHNDVGITLTREGCTAQSRISDTGAAVEDIDGTWNGDAYRIWFSSGLMLEALKPYKGGPVKIEMSGHLRPATITSTATSLISAVMPINVPGMSGPV
jgi:DNA polymerase III sliding clamp (beta) subunit (PCNA family)